MQPLFISRLDYWSDRTTSCSISYKSSRWSKMQHHVLFLIKQKGLVHCSCLYTVFDYLLHQVLSSDTHLQTGHINSTFLPEHHDPVYGPSLPLGSANTLVPTPHRKRSQTTMKLLIIFKILTKTSNIHVSESQFSDKCYCQITNEGAESNLIIHPWSGEVDTEEMRRLFQFSSDLTFTQNVPNIHKSPSAVYKRQIHKLDSSQNAHMSRTAINTPLNVNRLEVFTQQRQHTHTQTVWQCVSGLVGFFTSFGLRWCVLVLFSPVG